MNLAWATCDQTVDKNKREKFFLKVETEKHGESILRIAELFPSLSLTMAL